MVEFYFNYPFFSTFALCWLRFLQLFNNFFLFFFRVLFFGLFYITIVDFLVLSSFKGNITFTLTSGLHKMLKILIEIIVKVFHDKIFPLLSA